MGYMKIKRALVARAFSTGVQATRLPLLAVCISSALAAPAIAQAQPAQRMPFNIPAQPLDAALRRFSEQSRQQVLFSESAVAGRRAPAVTGSYTPQEALARLLEGSGVRVNATRPGVFTLAQDAASPARSKDAQTTLQTVNVTANGPGDGSYTTRELSLGKLGQSIRQTPQSVSVITRQQLDDRNLTTLDEALAQTTGVTKTARNFGNHKFSIRSFTVDDSNYLVDGVAGIVYAPVGWLPIDTAVLERVEVLRGAGGMMLGAADPSGAINMVRKRPRDQAHLDLAATLGSWDNYRLEVDGGGPLNAAGSVRGRLVAAYQDRDYFQRGTSSKTPVAYGVIDADLGQDTTLTFGLRHQASDTDGYWLFGLPRYTDGGALDIKRSTSLIQDWNRQEGSVDEAFAEAEHRFNERWKARLSVNRTESDLDQRVAVPVGGVDRATGIGSRFYVFRGEIYQGEWCDIYPGLSLPIADYDEREGDGLHQRQSMPGGDDRCDAATFEPASPSAPMSRRRDICLSEMRRIRRISDSKSVLAWQRDCVAGPAQAMPASAKHSKATLCRFSNLGIS